MNPLDQYPEVRKYLYMLQWVANGVLAVAGAVFLFNGTDMDDLPQWYVIACGVAPVLWTYLGITAQTNIHDSDGKDGTVLVEDTPLPAEPVVQPSDPNDPNNPPPMYPPTTPPSS